MDTNNLNINEEEILSKVEEPNDLCKVLKLAIELAKDNQILAISTIQRKLGFGWPKAAKLFDILDELGYLEPINPKSAKRCTATDETLEQLKSFFNVED